jgi:hypothetical protein
MRTLIVGTVAALGLAQAARADTTLVTLTYADLSGNYTVTNGTTGTFNAHAVDIANLHSAGDVSRIVAPIGTADFQPGFVSGADMSDFVMSMSVTHNGSTGSGSGSFTATDADGDTITGNLSGSWSIQNNYLAFAGSLNSVVIHDNGAQDHTFNGSNTGSWDTNLGFPGPYNGAIVHLTANINNNFFVTSFANAATGATAQITTVVPLPAGAYAGLGTLAGVFGLGLVRRRAHLRE